MEALVRLVLVSAPEAAAGDIAKTVVLERLAAGASIVAGMHSLYWWQGKLEEAAEALLIFRTDAELVAALAERVRELHPYKVPEIQTIEASSENAAYAKWVQEVTQQPAEARARPHAAAVQKPYRTETVTDVLRVAAATPLKVVVVGAPGAGARTLGYRIARRLRWNYYAPIEKHIKPGGADELVREFLDTGRLIPDDLILKEAEAALADLEAGGVVAGFPMTRPQAKLLKSTWNSPGIVFLLNLSQGEAQKRLAGRLSCACGRTYGLAVPPHKAGACDVCGESLFRRRDDQSEAAIRERFRTWTNTTKPAVLGSFAQVLHPLEAGRGYEYVMREASGVLMKVLAERETAGR